MAMEEIDDIPTIQHKSMSKEEAQNRLIDPENIVIGGKTSASMYEFMPSEKSTGMEDFIEERDYFEKYQAAKKAEIPFDIIQESFVEYPEKLDAFVFPYGKFNHFVAPKRPYGKELLFIQKCLCDFFLTNSYFDISF